MSLSTRTGPGLGRNARLVDASGNFLRSAPPEGPGEFNMPAGFAVTRDGTTIVADLGHRAYQLFDTDGGFLRMVSEGDGPGGLRGPCWRSPWRCRIYGKLREPRR